MKRILAPILLLTLLFPSIAYGETDAFELLLKSLTQHKAPESLTQHKAPEVLANMDDLVKRDGIHYKKFSDVPFTGKVTGKSQGSFRNGIKHGSWVSYYDNGQLRSKGTYKDGKWDGIHYKKFTEVPFTGKTTGKSQETFRNDKKDGPWVDYWKSGKLSQKGTYKDDKKHGPWVGYHENGQLDYKGTFKDGKREGPWVGYHYYGQLMHKGTFKDGNQDGPWVGFNKDGTVNEEYTGTFKNGVKVK